MDLLEEDNSVPVIRPVVVEDEKLVLVWIPTPPSRLSRLEEILGRPCIVG
jgi:hypothetical protein